MRYPRAYNPFTDSGEEEGATNPFYSDEGTEYYSDRGSMTNLLPQSRHSNPFDSSGEDDQPQQLHNKYKRKSNKLKRNVKEEDKPFIQSDNIKIEVSKEYNPFSSSEEEEDKAVQRENTAENIRAKRAGLVAVMMGIILLCIVIIIVMAENREVLRCFRQILHPQVLPTVILLTQIHRQIFI